MSQKRTLRKRRRKRRKRKAILAILSLTFLLFISYSAYEYLSGKHEAMENQASAEDGEGIDFEESPYKDSFRGVDNGDEKMTILLLGTDQRGTETARTDTIMLAEYNKENQDVKMVSLMRDTYVDIPGHGYNKLNAAFAIGGPELLRETIVDNFAVEPEYYAIVDFKGFTHIVDTLAPDGIEVDIDKDMYYEAGGDGTKIDLKAGKQQLDGEELLGYVRFRSDIRSDFGRVERQQEAIGLLKDQLVSFSGVLKAPRLIGTVQPYIDTNIEGTKVVDIGKDILLHPPEDIETLSIPTTDNVWNERKEYPIGLVLNHDEDKTQKTLRAFLDGGTEEPESP
ncbi:UNVERIFIED_CONTAM: LCP family protein [Halobacillus marinus]|uniref:LCP family protein n=1 Tax=Bacillaceae TaxID=186817 RepID=UPI00047E83E5|nr:MULTISPECIES: LCP family protein [Bacillaceae]QHT46033.1 LCP family protein [Bacillus sp. SB49]